MNNQNNKQSGPPAPARQNWSLKRVLKSLTKFVIPLCILVIAVAFAKYQINTRPKARRKKPSRQSRLVTVESVRKEDCVITIEAWGTVVAATRVTINPEVSGKIIFMAPEVIPGGIIKQEQQLVRIDPRDYKAIVKRRESELAKAQLNLKVEYGNQSVAEQEYAILDEVIDEQDKELILRKPQLESAKAALEAANAELEKANLDVQRCTITAPFNAIIQEKHVDLGARVSPSSSLITVIGTDEYWVEVLVSVDKLQWIDIPETLDHNDSAVKIFNPAVWGDQVFRRGGIVRLLGGLEKKGRMAQLLVSIEDPLCLQSDGSDTPIMLTDSYVKVEIQGRRISGVVPVKRGYLHDGDNVWVMNAKDELEIRRVKSVFRGEDIVWVTNGLEEGERIVTTDIATPVQGMQLRLESSATDAAQKTGHRDRQNMEGHR